MMTMVLLVGLLAAVLLTARLVTIGLTVTAGGATLSKQFTRTAETEAASSVALAAGQSGTLSTRTSATAGVATLASGHGITADDTVDIYWTGGVAYGADVDSVDETTVTFSGAAGDMLPAQTTAIIVAKREPIDIAFDGDNVQVATALLAARGHLLFVEGDGTVVAAVELTADEPWLYVADYSPSNPLSGELIARCYASNAGAAAQTLSLLVAYDT